MRSGSRSRHRVKAGTAPSVSTLRCTRFPCRTATAARMRWPAPETARRSSRRSTTRGSTAAFVTPPEVLTMLGADGAGAAAAAATWAASATGAFFASAVSTGSSWGTLASAALPPSLALSATNTSWPSTSNVISHIRPGLEDDSTDARTRRAETGRPTRRRAREYQRPEESRSWRRRPRPGRLRFDPVFASGTH